MARKRITMQMSEDCRSIKKCYQEFIGNCKARNLSSRTIDNYQEGYNLFCCVIDELEDITSVKNSTIQTFVQYLQQNTNSSATSINTRLRSIRSFLNYCYNMDYINKVKVPMLKVDKEIKEPYTEEELKKLLVKPNLKKCSFTEYRNWVMVNVFVGTGMRLNTLLNLRLSDIDLESGTILLSKTKNRKQQYIPLSRSLAKVLQEYLTYRQVDNDYLFTNAFGDQLTDSAIKIAIRKYNRGRGVEKTSIHLFRHTFAKHYLMSGGDVFRLQKLLSHSTLDVTKTYISLHCSDLAVDYENHCLLDSLSQSRSHIKLGGSK